MREMTLQEKLRALRAWDEAVKVEAFNECPICGGRFKTSPFNKTRQNTCGRRTCVNVYYDREKRKK